MKGTGPRSREVNMSERSHEDQNLERLLRHAGPRAAVPEDVARRVRASVHAVWDEQRSRHRRRPLAWVLAAAAVVVFALVAFNLSRRAPAPELASVAHVDAVAGDVKLGLGDVLPAGRTLRTGPGQQVSLHTVAGPSVRLDADSTLALRSANVFSLERGAVYVDSGSARDATLAIDTPLGEVRHVGTQYAVRLSEGSIRVGVREGRVQIGSAQGPLVVDAGSELSLSASGATHAEALLPYGPHWAWVQQIARSPRIDGRPLGELLEWVSRECGRKVRFESPALAARSATISLNGSIDGLTPEAALDAVLPTCGLTYHLEQDALLIAAEPSSAD